MFLIQFMLATSAAADDPVLVLGIVAASTEVLRDSDIVLIYGHFAHSI